tara:strand:- start:1023 stop:1280 length:258 start_codon:yes stop_codon:yes gene_type:complete
MTRLNTPRRTEAESARHRRNRTTCAYSFLDENGNRIYTTVTGLDPRGYEFPILEEGETHPAEHNAKRFADTRIAAIGSDYLPEAV